MYPTNPTATHAAYARRQRAQRAAQFEWDNRMPDDDDDDDRDPGRRCPECHCLHDGERATCEDCRVTGDDFDEPDDFDDDYDPRGENEYHARLDRQAERY